MTIINARDTAFHCILQPLTGDAHNQELGVEDEVTVRDMPDPVPIYTSFTLIKSELT
jgi:hypothetical protein